MLWDDLPPADQIHRHLERLASAPPAAELLPTTIVGMCLPSNVDSEISAGGTG